MARRSFYKVDAELLPLIGSDEVLLLAILENAAKVWKKDKNGYFAIFMKYLMERTGWWQKKVIRVRTRLVELNLIDYTPGKNQNVPGKYKIKR